MANKQIHELPPMGTKAFRPARDNFIAQKPGGRTVRASIAKMIDDPSVDLPGSTDWNWNWLDKPATIAPYSKVDYSMSSFSKVDYEEVEENLPNSTDIGYPNLLNLSYEYDAITRMPTGIPKNAKSLMCVAFLNNCDLHLIGSRTKPVVSSQRLPDVDRITYGWNSNPVETVFVVNNVSRPENYKINQNSGEQIRYMQPNKLSFELKFRLAQTGAVQFGGSYFNLQSGTPTLPEFNIQESASNPPIVWDSSQMGGYIAQKNLDSQLNRNRDYIFTNINPAESMEPEPIGEFITSQEDIEDILVSKGSKVIDSLKKIYGDLDALFDSVFGLPSSLFSQAVDSLADLVGKIPFVGPILAPLLGSREGFELLLDQAAMARLLSDPSFIYEYFIERTTILETPIKRQVAGWELFYIKVLAWN
jgi:hypothetical protein